jgi:hypothetical protein
MRTLRFTVAGWILFSAATWAQDGRFIIPRASVEDVVARLLTFDANKDGKVTAAELNDRMKNLVGRGDANGDGGLDAGEIRAVATAATTALDNRLLVVRRPSLRGARPPAPPGGVAGLVNDLKLPPERRQTALDIVAEYQAALTLLAQGVPDVAVRNLPVALDPDGVDLVRRLEPVLTPDELTDLKAALARRPALIGRGRGRL